MNQLVSFIGHPSSSLIAAAGDRAQFRFLEFFSANIRNAHTRRAYAQATREFLAWCETAGVRSIHAVQPVHVAAYVEQLARQRSAPTVKQRLSAIRHLFDWLVIGQVIPMNPAVSVRGPKHIVKRGKTPVLSPKEARKLLESIDVSTHAGLRDRAIVSSASRFDAASFFAMVPPSPPSHWRGGAGQAHRRWKMCDGWPAGPAPSRFYSTPIGTDPDPYSPLHSLGARLTLRLHDDACGAVRERARATNPLHRAGIDPKPLRDLAHAGPWPSRSARAFLIRSSGSGAIRGRPGRFPSLLARARPARTRSWIMLRSNSANTPSI